KASRIGMSSASAGSRRSASAYAKAIELAEESLSSSSGTVGAIVSLDDIALLSAASLRSAVLLFMDTPLHRRTLARGKHSGGVRNATVGRPAPRCERVYQFRATCAVPLILFMWPAPNSGRRPE